MYLFGTHMMLSCTLICGFSGRSIVLGRPLYYIRPIFQGSIAQLLFFVGQAGQVGPKVMVSLLSVRAALTAHKLEWLIGTEARQAELELERSTCLCNSNTEHLITTYYCQVLFTIPVYIGIVTFVLHQNILK